MQFIQRNASQNEPGIRKGFYFKRRRERVDWRLVASLHLDRIQREVDLDSLKAALENIAFCDIETEDLRYVDPNLVKMFQAAQLIIEYMLHSQEYLLNQRRGLYNSLETANASISTLSQKSTTLTEENNSMKKEIKNLKKALYAYQIMAKLPNGLSANGPVVATTFHRCEHCTKVFTGHEYLEAHMRRRHPECEFKHENKENHQENNEAEKLRETIKDLQQKMIETERKLRLDMEARIAKEIEQRQQSLNEMHNREKQRHEAELIELRAQLKRSYAPVQAPAPVVAAPENIVNNRSRFGNLEDDEEPVQIVAQLVTEPQSNDWEARQNANLEEMQRKMALELEALKAKMQSEQQRERALLQEQLRLANEKLSEKTTVKVEKKVLLAEPKPTNTSTTTTTTKTTTTTLKEKPKLKLKPRPIQTESTSTKEPLDWPLVLEYMSRATFEQPDAPWTKSLFNHTSEDFAKTKENTEKMLDFELLKQFNIDVKSFVKNYDSKDPDNSKAELLKEAQQAIAEKIDDSRERPLFSEMYAYLGANLEATSYRDRKDRPVSSPKEAKKKPSRYRATSLPTRTADFKSTVKRSAQLSNKRLKDSAIVAIPADIVEDYEDPVEDSEPHTEQVDQVEQVQETRVETVEIVSEQTVSTKQQESPANQPPAEPALDAKEKAASAPVNQETGTRYFRMFSPTSKTFKDIKEKIKVSMDSRRKKSESEPAKEETKEEPASPESVKEDAKAEKTLEKAKEEAAKAKAKEVAEKAKEAASKKKSWSFAEKIFKKSAAGKKKQETESESETESDDSEPPAKQRKNMQPARIPNNSNQRPAVVKSAPRKYQQESSDETSDSSSEYSSSESSYSDDSDYSSSDSEPAKPIQKLVQKPVIVQTRPAAQKQPIEFNVKNAGNTPAAIVGEFNTTNAGSTPAVAAPVEESDDDFDIELSSEDEKPANAIPTTTIVPAVSTAAPVQSLPPVQAPTTPKTVTFNPKAN